MRPLRCLATLVLLVPGGVAAETVVVQLGDSNVSAALARTLERTAEATLEELSALERTPPRGPVRKGCIGDLTCLQAVATGANADHAFVLRARQSGARLTLSAYWVDAERGTVQSRAERTADAPDVTVRELVVGLLPPYTRKGYGALVVDGERGAVVKVDGRKVGVMPLDAPLVLPAGTYAVDVVTPSGASVLREEKVAEGTRTPVAALTTKAGPAGADGRTEVMTWTSYGLWGASALALTGAFISGSIARRASGELRPCSATSRDCTGFEEAQRLSERSGRYARNANILLGMGLVLGAAGGGLYGYTRYEEARARAGVGGSGSGGSGGGGR